MVERPPGRYLITQRATAATLPLLWEFPGGRVRDGETDEGALVRTLRERLGLTVSVLERAMTTHHAYDDYTIDFVVFRCAPVDAEPAVSHDRVNDHRWVTLSEMGDYDFPPADAKTLERLLE